jgi:hypothetical protein
MRIRTNEVMVVNSRLTQVGVSFRDSRKYRSAVFLCECGNRSVIQVVSVSSGKARSCGCLRVDSNVDRMTKHGHARDGQNKSREYKSWNSLKNRCENPNNHKWDDYGGRGITVCERWSKSFEAFLEDMGPRPDGCTIDRENNDGNYEPGNCRWANNREQQRNRRANRLVEWNGRIWCLTELAEELGIKPVTVFGRLNRGWSVEKALTHPIRKRKK